jgi:hypothetical protein
MNKITCGNIRFTEDTICELDGFQEIVSILKTTITSGSFFWGKHRETSSSMHCWYFRMFIRILYWCLAIDGDHSSA